MAMKSPSSSLLRLRFLPFLLLLFGFDSVLNAQGSPPVPGAPISVSTFAGSVQGSRDGFRTEATFSFPTSIALASDGRLFVAEAHIVANDSSGPGAHRIRVIDPDGTVSTYAGGNEPGYQDGFRLNARFSGPNSLALDRNGNLFVCERVNNRIRKIDPQGNVTTFAGSEAGHQDGTSANARFSAPISICIDRDDNLYVADFLNSAIRKVTPQGEVSTLAGTPGAAGFQNGPGNDASFSGPAWVAISASGDLFVADWGNGAIRQVTKEGVVSTFAVNLPTIEVVAVDPRGAVYASLPAGGGTHAFIKHDSVGIRQWSLGNSVGFQDGPAATAQFEHYSQPLFLPDGNILMVDGHRLRLIEISDDTVTEMCTTAPPGIAAWWPGDGGVQNLVPGAPDAQNNGVSFAAGKVGQAFQFSESGDHVKIPASAATDVGLSEGFTFECWINPSDTLAQQPIAEWNSGTQYGLHFYLSVPGPHGGGPGCLFANLRGTDGVDRWFTSDAGVVQANQWQHVALTYEKAAGTAAIYLNGTLLVQQTLGSYTPETSYDLLLGLRPAGFDGSPLAFLGGMDEASLYHRALSAAEIQGIARAGSAGKCFPSAPVLTYQLRSDWSEVANPNGPWAFWAGDALLPHVAEWSLDPANLHPGWAFDSTIPFWFRSVSGPAPGSENDWAAGDVVVHTHNPGGPNGPTNGLASLTWTSPVDGTLDVTGGVWEARNLPDLSGGVRGNRWNLYLRDELISSGVVTGDDLFDRAHPFDLASGSGGSEAIRNLRVFAGDVLRLALVPTGFEGDYVGVNLTVFVRPVDAPAAWIVSTLAGSGQPGRQDGAGIAAAFNAPNAGYTGPGQFAYIADTRNHVIRRVDISTGDTVTIAGTGVPGNADGPVAIAQFNLPMGAIADLSGNLYVADTGNNRIRKISAGAQPAVSTYAGSGTEGYLDGPASVAQFNFPNDLALDSRGNLFVSEFSNHAIRKIAPDGTVSTFVGNGTRGYADGLGTAAGLNQPAGLALDREGNLFVTEWGSQRIRKVSPEGAVKTLAGTVFPGFRDGEGVDAGFYLPDGIAVDGSGVLYVTEQGNHAVRRISPGGEVTTLAGTGLAGFADGPAKLAQFNGPGGIGLAADGTVIIVDTGNHRIRQIRYIVPPQVTLEPRTQSVVIGSRVEFNPRVSGTGPLTYQWRRDGQDIPGATGNSLALVNVQLHQAGAYSVVVRNPMGAVESSASVLTVLMPIRYERFLPAYYAPGVRVQVRLEAILPEGVAGYAHAVEEFVPPGWTVGNISAPSSGTYDPVTHKVKFGPFFDFQNRVLLYEIIPPANATGTYKIRGITSADGSEQEVAGEDTLLPPPLHPADLAPADRRMVINELTAYSAAWRRGTPWSVEPNPIPIDYVTRAGFLWKNGERYAFNPGVAQPPLWWTNAPSAGAQAPAGLVLQPISAQAPRASRTLPAGLVVGEPFVVSVLAKPGPGVFSYAVEEQIPAGVVVANVTEGGEYDAQNRLLKWGPFFDAAERTLSYSASSSERSVTIAGRISIDGASFLTEGPSQLQAIVRLLSVQTLPTGELALDLGAPDGQVYVIQTSTNLQQWTNLITVTNQTGRLQFSDPDGFRLSQKFYRLSGGGE